MVNCTDILSTYDASIVNVWFKLGIIYSFKNIILANSLTFQSMTFAQFNFVAVALTWLFQFNLLSILTPRYFTESVVYNHFPFNFIFMLKCRGFLLGLKKISSVFETFNEILLALSQFVRFFRSIFKSLFNPLRERTLSM